MIPLALLPRTRWRLLPALLLLAACAEPAPMAPAGTPAAARTTSTDPSIGSINPAVAAPGTTLGVRVYGSGFDKGSKVSFARAGALSTEVVTNGTTFINSRELLANVTVRSDADVALYDVVVVTALGKKGIGTEMFEVAYQAIDLGAPSGGDSEAVAINNNNQIVGTARARRGADYPFIWQNGVMTKLPVPGMAWAINDAGWVAGTAYPRWWIWRASTGSIEWHDPPAGSASFQPAALNEAGQVVGSAGGRAYLWHNGAYTDLQTLPGATSSSAYDINESGVVVGKAFGGGAEGSFRYTPGRGMELLGGAPDGGEALAINDAGAIVGWFNVGAVKHAYLWKDGVRTDLGAPSADASSVALGVSSGGVVVGREDFIKPFIWTAYGGRQLLGSTRLVPQGWANDINTAGWIVGKSGSRATLWRMQ